MATRLKLSDTKQKGAPGEAGASFCRRDGTSRPTAGKAESIDVTNSLRDGTGRRLKIVEQLGTDLDAPKVPQIDQGLQQSTTLLEFDPAPTRKQHAGWTAERQRAFIDRLALTGSVGEACAIVGVASSSAYRLRNKAGAEDFARAWDAALSLAATRLSAIAFDRAINGRAERFYKDGELVMERRMPSDYMLTWLLARLDPAQFGSPTAQALAAATGNPRDAARADLPTLAAALRDVSPEDCECDDYDEISYRTGETDDGKVDTSD